MIRERKTTMESGSVRYADPHVNTRPRSVEHRWLYRRHRSPTLCRVWLISLVPRLSPGHLGLALFTLVV